MGGGGGGGPSEGASTRRGRGRGDEPRRDQDPTRRGSGRGDELRRDQAKGLDPSRPPSIPFRFRHATQQYIIISRILRSIAPVLASDICFSSSSPVVVGHGKVKIPTLIRFWHASHCYSFQLEAVFSIFLRGLLRFQYERMLKYFILFF